VNHAHTEACEWRAKKGGSNGQRYCLSRRRELDQSKPEEVRSQILTKQRDRDRRRRGKAPVLAVDGLEPEYGPVPEFVPERAWYDQVAVDRILSGSRPVGRRLTPLETKEVLRIKAEKDPLDNHLTWAAIKG
jgi:hypothetical protein